MTALVAAGLWLGLFAGAWDALAILLENPRSFPNAPSALSFAGAALAAYGVAGGAAGALAGLVRRVTGRPSVSIALAAGLALWLFLWAGVRVHVRWFFGEPLLSSRSLLANGALFAVSVVVALLARPLTRRLAMATGRRAVVAASAIVVLGGALATVRPALTRPTTKPSAPPPGARDVLLVTLDTTRADHLSSFGYPRGTTPAIDRLARTGSCDVLWAAAPLTNPSHCSLLTGLPPRSHGVLNNGTPLPRGVPTIVETLSAEGWTCAAFVSGIPLKAELSGLARGFDVYDDAFSALERVHPMLTSLAAVRVADRVLPGDLLERRAVDTVDRATAWLEGAERPRFLWVHLFDPHTPYRASHALVRRFGREGAEWTAAGRAVTEWPLAAYDAELRGTDAALGRLVRAFEEASPNGAICVVADHGEGLLQHGELTHGSLLQEEDLRIAWIVKGGDVSAPDAPARLRGLRPPRPATDVRAMLDALARGLPPPPAGDVPVVADTFPPEGRGRRSAVVGLLPDGRIGKTIVDWERGVRLAYDLTADPGETRSMDATGSEWAQLAPPPPDSTEAQPLDPDVARRLKALGYVH